MDGPRSGDRPESGGRGVDRALWAVLGVILAATIGYGLYHLVVHPRPEPLPILGELPDFELTERSGRALTASDLDGHVWVVDFIFTRCAGICPVLSSAMESLQESVDPGGDVRLLTVSVDPTYDSVEVLQDYAARFDAHPQRWLFATGEHDAIYRLVRDGFRLSVARADPAEVAPGDLITHSDRLVIVDRHRRIRAYHHGTEPSAVEAVLADLTRLVEDR